jgi:hypothetical protein
MSAEAGPASPRTAAPTPLAMTVANPNFFILVPSLLVRLVARLSRLEHLWCRWGILSIVSDVLNGEVRGLIPLAAIDRRLAGIDYCPA